MTTIVTLQPACETQQAPSITQFQHWVDVVSADLKLALETEVCVKIIGTEESSFLNGNFRHKSGPTNVLSFNSDSQEPYLGDIAICADIVTKEALEQQKSKLTHWAHLTIHGLLHLLGYDHDKAAKATIMEAIEVKVLAKLGYDNPYE